MTLEISIKHDLKRLRKRLSSLSDKVVVNITNQALNAAGKKMLTKSSRLVRDASGIAIGKVKKNVKLRRSNRSQLRVIITASRRKSNNLIEFVVPSKVKVGAFKKKAGVAAKGFGRKKAKIHKGTFIVRGRNSGKLIVVSRKSGSTGNRKSSWSKTIYGPNIQKIFIKDKNSKATLDAGLDVFGVEFKRQAERAIHRHLNKGRKR